MGAPSGKKGGKGVPPPPAPPKDTAGPPKGKGKVAPEAFDELKGSYGVGEGVRERLMGTDAVFCTSAFLETFQLFVNAFSKEYTKTTVTKLGDGRGKADEVQTEVVTRGLEDAIVMLESHSALGKEFHSMAEKWLKANSGDGQQESAGRAWVSEAVIARDMGVTSRKTKEISDEDRQERERLQQQMSMQMEEERRRRYEHWLALAPASLHGVPWSTCKQTMFIEGGSGGCLLAELDGGSVICLKPQKMMAVSEFLAERMLHALNIPVASCRIVNWTEDEFHQITEHVLKAPVMVPGQEANVRTVLTGMATESENLGIEYIGVLEFVPGHGLMGLEGQSALTGDTADRLYEGIGAICAVDALLNNLDRIPLPLWSNDGNLSNIMVSGGRVVAIDQQVNLVLDGPGLDRYIGKLRELFSDLQRGVSSNTASTVKLAFLENTGTDIPDSSLLLLLLGLSNTLRRIAALWQSGQLRESIDDAEQAAMTRFDMSATDVGQTRVEAMCAFLRRTAEEIASIFGPVDT